MNSLCETSDLLVFSHLRWDFVFQRPQHLLLRHAQNRRVFYFEEPVFGMTEMPRLHIKESKEKVQIVVPYLPSGMEAMDMEAALRELVDELVSDENISDMTLWYYSPMAQSFSDHLNADVVIFDCMDDFSLFKEAPQAMIDQEAKMMKRADVVFTGGQSIYGAKKYKHSNIHPFPSSIDFDHFSQARKSLAEPGDQICIPHPRIGYYGVIDDKFDIDLFEKMADLRPDYHFVVIGPVVKIDENSLPKRENIHYLGKKEYCELPLYLAGWDCAIMPFALNDSTRFISPSKTPEYLAAGKPVVSTSIYDVVHPYADAKLVYIADDAHNFVKCIEQAMNEKSQDQEWIKRVDQFLDGNCWQATFDKMVHFEKLIRESKRAISSPIKTPVYLDSSLSAIGIV